MHKQLGLVGYPLSHSLSGLYFAEKFRLEKIRDYSYELFPLLKISGLPGLIMDHPALIGFNVTIPHKISIMAQLDDIDTIARATGAVNTVKVIRNKDGYKLSGFNTDTAGFEAALSPFLKARHKQALILGTGGSARAVAHVLKSLGIDYKMVSREPGTNDLGYQELDRELMEKYTLIVNCSPAGMFPEVMKAPEIPYSFLGKDHLLFDLVYNPVLTRFLKNGRAQGAQIVNGMEMLKKQAEKAWEIWTGNKGTHP